MVDWLISSLEGFVQHEFVLHSERSEESIEWLLLDKIPHSSG